MVSTVTVTAHCGPNRLLTAGVFTNVTDYFLDIARNVLTFKSNGQYHEFDLSAVATITDVIVSPLHTVTVSE
jgi:hypothetical protein